MANLVNGEELFGVIPASLCAQRTSNPLRKLVDRLKPPTNSGKTLISLSIGDPTVFGNMKTDDLVNKALAESIFTFNFNGYVHASGLPAARKAIAETHATPNGTPTEEDVVITSGCSGALLIAMEVLANEGDNILVPKPGFSLYQTICDSKGFETRYYSLLPEKSWEVDLEHLESLIDDKTRAILLNNPSNPCGSVYRKEHLQEILKVAERRRIPIIADEIYEDMTFDGYTFHSLASLSTKVPIISVGGLAKRYLIPGWRLGWLVLHDRGDAFSAVRRGCHSLATLILGANSLVQSIVPTVLHNTPPEYYVRTMKMLQDQANHFAKRVSQVPGLKPITPQGAMYLMVQVDCSKFKDIKDDVEFSEKLVQEELVVVLPGQIFKSPNFFRVVISAPIEVLDQACDRIAAFCARHSA